MTAMSGRAGTPVASMTVTPVMASDFAGASSIWAGSAPARAMTVRQAIRCFIEPSEGCGEVGRDHDTTFGGAPTTGRLDLNPAWPSTCCRTVLRSDRPKRRTVALRAFFGDK